MTVSKIYGAMKAVQEHMREHPIAKTEKNEY